MNMSDEAHFGQETYPEPERTSLAAVFGLILSIGGCLGGITALLGVPLSVFGIIASARSNGRVGGKGLGIAGLLVGLLTLAVWGGCLGGAAMLSSMMLERMIKPTSRALVSIDAGQFDAARANLLSPAADVSDQEFEAFRAAYQASLGTFQSGPAGRIEWVTEMGEVEPLLGATQGQQQILPFKGDFSGGPALILVSMDQQASGIVGITIIDLNGDEYTLPMPGGWNSPDTTEEAPTDDASPDPEP
ncbi:MAG: DUF4190 domain-containing protein [Planctomycetota bacterium]